MVSDANKDDQKEIVDLLVIDHMFEDEDEDIDPDSEIKADHQKDEVFDSTSKRSKVVNDQMRNIEEWIEDNYYKDHLEKEDS